MKIEIIGGKVWTMLVYRNNKDLIMSPKLLRNN